MLHRALLLLALAGCGPPGSPTIAPSTARTDPPPAVGRLLHLMRDRLVLMHDVARTKWNSKRPVGDPQREEALLREVEAEGRAHGLDPLFTRSFFAAQMAAARRAQEADHAHWRAEGRGPFRDAPDLAALRKRIDGLNRELLDALAEAKHQLADAGVRDQLHGWAQVIFKEEGIAEVSAIAVEPLVAP